VVEVRDARHQELGAEYHVADVDRLGRNAIRPIVGERDVPGAVAEHGVDRVRRGHAMWNWAHSTNTLRESDRIVDVSAEKEVLESTPEVTVCLSIGDRRAVRGDLDAKVTFDTGNRVDFVGSSCAISHLLVPPSQS
jgi:hypothetical protein